MKYEPSLTQLAPLPAILIALGLISTLSACAVGPNYTKPETSTAVQYKELVDDANHAWKLAKPNEAAMNGSWWDIYHDDVLNELMKKINLENQNIRASDAQYRQAVALLEQAQAGLFPSISANGTASTGTSAAQRISTGNVGASWVPDLWGQVRRSIEANSATAQASAAQLDALRLSTQATLAQTYFQLRLADMQIEMYDRTVQAYEKSLEMTRNRYNAGIVTQLDVSQAATLLASTRALAIDIKLSRAQLEHAIAVLTGQNPSGFSLPTQVASVDPVTGVRVSPVIQLVESLPEVPVSIPSVLLERRPDIAAAERQMAAANAKIGVAVAAFFPNLSISAAGGYQNLSSSPLRIWSLGSGLTQPLFDAGLRSGAVSQANAAYDQSVANYRQVVLTAFQNVEDNLVALRLLQEESKAQSTAVKHAQNAVRVSLNQYKEGVLTYLDVVTAQATELSNERTLMTLLNRQIAAHVGLIAALGGDWDIKSLDKK